MNSKHVNGSGRGPFESNIQRCQLLKYCGITITSGVEEMSLSNSTNRVMAV